MPPTKWQKRSHAVTEGNASSSLEASTGLRLSDRVSLRMPLEASWTTSTNAIAKHIAETLFVSRNGGVLRLDAKLLPGQELHLRRSQDGDQWKSVRARVVAEIDQEPPHSFIYAIHILDPECDFWDIDFPPPDRSEEAIARLLMECSFCRQREVVYMNEAQVKSFEIRKCVAHLCKQCGYPTIWIDSLSEARSTDDPAANPAAEERGANRRRHSRLKARLLACLRSRAFQEEICVCEDLSKGGLSFRSRNHYPEGTRLEVAVPFTPSTGAIFVPIRIIFSQDIPAAGLYRHGAAYIKPPFGT